MTRGPEPAAIFWAFRPGEIFSSIGGGNLLNGFGLLTHARRAAMEFKQQQGRFLEFELAIGVGGPNRHGVHEFDTGDRYTHLYDLDHALHRRTQIGKIADGRRDGFRLGVQPDRDLRSNASRTLAAHKDTSRSEE